MAPSKKGCELCGKAARMLYESDQATLCWDCDEKVHAANFLVAKHYRTLLCHVCHSPTPWKAAGPKLAPTVSVCSACAEGPDTGGRREEEEIEDDGCDSAESESDGGDYYSDSDDDYSEEEDGENQVVPWSESPASPSQSEENASLSSSSKRTRADNPFESEDEDGCCSSQQDFEYKIGASEMTVQESARRLKMGKMSGDGDGGRLIPPEEAAAAAAQAVRWGQRPL